MKHKIATKAPGHKGPQLGCAARCPGVFVDKNNDCMKFEKLTIQEEDIGKSIVSAAFKVHKILGPGLLEKVYEACLVHELRKSGLLVARQLDIPIQYDGITI